MLSGEERLYRGFCSGREGLPEGGYSEKESEVLWSP